MYAKITAQGFFELVHVRAVYTRCVIQFPFTSVLIIARDGLAVRY